MPNKHLHSRPVAIILASILILGAAIYAVLMMIAHVGDSHQRDIEERIVQSALGQHRMKLGGMMIQQAYWDSAYDAVSSNPDRRWLDANLGFSAQLGGVPVTLVFDGRAQIVYRFVG